jgi:excisionase family DNA binding protein
MGQIIYTISTDEFKAILKGCIREELSKINSAKDEEELLKADEAATLLQVSKMTLYKWRKAGILPFHRISSRIYFKKSELLEAMTKSPKYKR